MTHTLFDKNFTDEDGKILPVNVKLKQEEARPELSPHV